MPKTFKLSSLALILAATLALQTTPDALASRARILTLGTGDGGMILGSSGNVGSFTVNDRYNIFYNPAYLNDNRDWAIIEKSNYDGASAATAQGGFATSLMTYNLALYFNRVGALEGSYSQRSNMRPIDFIFATQTNDIKWGFNYSYALYSAQNGKTNRDHTVRLGAMAYDFEPYIHYKIDGRDRAGTAEVKNMAWGLGTRYHWGEWTPFAAFRQIHMTRVTNYWGLGLGRNTRAAEGVDINYSLSFFRASTKHFLMPINVSAEGELLPWLLLRAGLGYHLIDRIGSNGRPDNTTGRFGASIKMSKINLDWAIGKGASTLEGGEIDSQTFDIANNFFTAASVTYSW